MNNTPKDAELWSEILFELRRIVTRGGCTEMLYLMSNLSYLTGVNDRLSPLDQGAQIEAALRHWIGRWTGSIQIERFGKVLTEDECKEAWLINLGLINPYGLLNERRLQATKALGLTYPPGTWRKLLYEGKFFEVLARFIVKIA